MISVSFTLGTDLEPFTRVASSVSWFSWTFGWFNQEIYTGGVRFKSSIEITLMN